MRCIALLLASMAACRADAPPSPCGMGPPCGPRDEANCPVTGTAINITASTPHVEFTHGQKLYFATEVAAAAYRKQPRDYWLAPTDKPLPAPDGMRGLPDLRGLNVSCPRSGEVMVIAMDTPRVMHKHGQNVYFCCFGCVSAFWTDPSTYLPPL
jgi:YHS domain-containing protein